MTSPRFQASFFHPRYWLTWFSLALLATPSLAEVPAVVTDTPVTASLVQQVMGDLGQPALWRADGTAHGGRRGGAQSDGL